MTLRLTLTLTLTLTHCGLTVRGRPWGAGGSGPPRPDHTGAACRFVHTVAHGPVSTHTRCTRTSRDGTPAQALSVDGMVGADLAIPRRP